jgi:hypothetical protein
MGPAPTIAIRLSATSVTFHLMSAGMPMSLTCSVKVTPTAAPVGAVPRQPLCMVSQSGMRLRSARTPGSSAASSTSGAEEERAPASSPRATSTTALGLSLTHPARPCAARACFFTAVNRRRTWLISLLTNSQSVLFVESSGAGPAQPRVARSASSAV